MEDLFELAKKPVEFDIAKLYKALRWHDALTYNEITRHFKYYLYINNCSAHIHHQEASLGSDRSLARSPRTFFECYIASILDTRFPKELLILVSTACFSFLTRIYCSGTNSYVQEPWTYTCSGITMQTWRVHWCRWHRRNDCVFIKDRETLHTLTISRPTTKFQEISMVRINYTLPWPSVSKEHYGTWYTQQRTVRGHDVQWRLEMPVTQQWKTVVPFSSSMHSWKRSCTYTSAQSSVLLSNSLLTDLKDEAYSNLTILPALGHRGFITISNHLLSQNFILRLLDPISQEPMSSQAVTMGESNRVLFRTWGFPAITSYPNGQWTDCGIPRKQRWSVCGDETIVQCRWTTKSARGINLFDVLLWQIEHASKHGLAFSWTQDIICFPNGDIGTPIQPSNYSQNPEQHIRLPLIPGSSFHDRQRKSIVC